MSEKARDFFLAFLQLQYKFLTAKVISQGAVALAKLEIFSVTAPFLF